MAELADALDLGSSTARCEGSSPFIRIKTVDFLQKLSDLLSVRVGRLCLFSRNYNRACIFARSLVNDGVLISRSFPRRFATIISTVERFSFRVYKNRLGCTPSQERSNPVSHLPQFLDDRRFKGVWLGNY